MDYDEGKLMHSPLDSAVGHDLNLQTLTNFIPLSQTLAWLKK